jgi:NDP-sugar pyrophosphorylase family protein
MNSVRKSAMILAAGLGSRLGDMTNSRPKALIEINGEPLIKIVINKLKSNGFNHIVINVHHHADQIVSYLKLNADFETDIEISDESSQLLDTGGAILKALPLFKNNQGVLVHNVDIISDINLGDFYNSFINSSLDAQLLCRHRESNRKMLFNNDNLLIGWKNFETGETKLIATLPEKYQAVSFSGIHMIRPHLLTGFELKKCSIIDIYLQLAQSNIIGCTIIDGGYWFDLGKKEDFEKISLLLNRYK